MTFDPVQAWLNAAGRYPVLPKEEIIRLANKRDTLPEGSAAYIKVVNKICQHNLRLIPRVVSNYVRKRKTVKMSDTVVSDLLQQGYLGLRRAAEKFDAKRGYTFSTYSQSWIYQSLYRWHNAHDRAIYVPENTVGEIFYRHRHGKPSSSKTGKTGDGVIASALRAMSISSIDQRIGNEDDDVTSIADQLTDENLVIDRQTPLEGRAELKLKDLMAKCGIRPKVQDIVLAYARRPRMSIIASRLSMSPKHCQNLYSEAVRTMKSRVELDELEKQQRLAGRLGR